MSQSNNVTEEGNVVQPLHGSSSLVLSIQSQPPPPKSEPPSIDAHAVQCNSCFKWRVVPSLEKYEEIREQLKAKPFVCEAACDWELGMSCDVPENISQYGTSLWALDRPNIARAPTGWKRLLQIRGEGCSRFADVYYVSPTGKKLRSSVEVQKYLNDYPQSVEPGVNISHFSFQMPVPYEENYMRKRPARPSKRVKTAELSTSGPCDDVARQD